MLTLNVHKSFGGFTLAVDATSSAQVLGIVGASGSGKTTLLDCIAGTTAPDAGFVAIDGHTLVDTKTPGATLPPARRGIGYVFQDSLLFPHMSVGANLRYGRNAHGTGPELDDVVDALELGHLLDQRSDTLSGGEARRVAIGRAILSGPRLLLFDEPLSGLDRRLALKTLGLIRLVLSSFRIPAVYVSHCVSDVIFLCDDAWAISNGRVVSTGPPRQIVTRVAEIGAGAIENLENVFSARRVDAPTDDQVRYQMGNHQIVATTQGEAAGDEAILSVCARDIMLSRDHPGRISARNILPGTVARIEPFGRKLLVFVNLGPQWMVELTHAAAEELELCEGAEVFAIVKASSVSALAVPPARTH